METSLQREVIKLGRNTIFGFIILAIIMWIVGGLLTWWGWMNFDLKVNDDDKGEEEEEKENLGRTIFICGLLLIDLGLYLLITAWFGKSLKMAAETRNVQSLQRIFTWWIVVDVLAAAIVAVVVIATGKFVLIFMPALYLVGMWRRCVIRRFIQECKESPSSDTQA